MIPDPSKKAPPEFFQLLNDFLDIASRASSDLASFGHLLNSFQQLEEVSERHRPLDVTVQEAQDLFELFADVWPAYLEGQAEFPPSINIWSVAGLGADEVRNCQVLSWLLDPNGTHCQGNRFLKCLLLIMGERTAIADETPLSVRREAIAGDSRVDILIECSSCVICIEAKIQAAEDKQQLVRYHSRLGMPRASRGQRFVGKLLSVQGISGEQVGEGFTRMLWADVASALQAFAGSSVDSALAARNQFVREIAGQYSRFIHEHLRLNS